MLLEGKEKTKIVEDPNLPEHIRSVVIKLQIALGDIFSLENLIDVVSRVRKRPIKMVLHSLTLDKSGFVASFADLDLICIRDGMSQDKKLITYLHELAHLLLGHTSIREDRFDHTLSESEDGKLYHSIREHSYGSIQEKEAEALGTVLFLLIKEYEARNSVPSYAWVRIKGLVNG